MPSSRHMPSALPLNPTALERTWHIQDSQGQILASAFRQKPLISDLGFQIKVLNKSPQGVNSSLNSDPSLPHSLIPSLSLSHSLTPSLSGMDLVIACESRRCLIWLVHVVGPLPFLHRLQRLDVVVHLRAMVTELVVHLRGIVT